jgi:Flp pilus assembly protein TadD
MKSTKYLYLTLAALLFLGGCANNPGRANTLVSSSCAKPSSQAESMKLDLVSQLITQGNYYSALAHLESDTSKNPQVLWLRAESQRKTGLLAEAYDNYRDLSLTCMNAYGHSGMAKILATRGDISQAHQHMLKARKLAPTNADIRNDYGFIMLAHGDFKAAQREFMTALQLQPGHPVAIRNMVMSLILDGDQRTAQRMAKNNGINTIEFQELLSKAQTFHKATLADTNTIKDEAPL